MTGTTLKLDQQTIAILAGVVVPIVTGLITKYQAARGVKGSVNLLLSAIGGALSTWLASGSTSLDWRRFVIGVAMTWVISIATYYGVYKPTGIGDAVQMIKPNFGIGRPVQPLPARPVPMPAEPVAPVPAPDVFVGTPVEIDPQEPPTYQ